MSGTVIVGATGGCGVTTIACALSLMLPTDGAPALLVDADLHAGGPGSLWSLEPARGLDDLGALGDAVAAEHVDHLIHRHACGVDVMAGCASAASRVVHDPGAAAAVVEYVESRQCWVVDGGRGDSALAAGLMSRAHRVVVVAPCTLQGVSRAVAVVARLDARAVVAVSARWVAGERVPDRILERALAGPDVVAVGRDGGAAADIAAGRAPRGRGLARTLQELVQGW